jgi:hypothetical protein
LNPVELAPEVHASVRAMKDHGTPPRCQGWRDRKRDHGCGPDSMLATLGIARPDGVELEVLSEDLGQGETETSYRYQWSEGGRSILAEEVKNEIYDGATPYSTYVRGVIVGGDRGVFLTGSGGSAVVIEG